MLDSKGKNALQRFATFRSVSQCFCPIPPSASPLFGGIGNLTAATLHTLSACALQIDG
jgi:hypothetical protein